MGADQALYFASYRLDPRAQVLWQDDHPVRLTPKAFGVLDYLARHADRVVPKHELLDHVWPEVHVGDAVLKVAVREIRQALKDDPEVPRFVQTARRVGYRFVASVSATEPVRGDATIARSPTAPAPVAASWLVGRERPLDALTAAFARAVRGRRQVAFVVGEGGIGKTSVVETFLSAVERERTVWVARGQCLEHAGGAEAYLPVLDGLGRLSRLSGRERLVPLLRRFAPTWLAQMPALVDERDALQQEIVGATPERMLREIAEALEALTAETTLVLFLDDLHWSDDATLDFIGLMARRSGPSRLLLIGAYRPVDVALNRPALKLMKQELAAKGLCEEILLDFLTCADTAAFLDQRFPDHAFPSGLAALVHQRTSGNPLFMANLMDYLVAQGVVAQREDRWELTTPLQAVATASPETLRQVIEAQLTRLSAAEHGALEAASVCGVDFSALHVAAGLEMSAEGAEACLDGLARTGQFVVPLELGELPDGTWSPRYQFVHSLHQEVLYRSLPPARRLRLHLRVAERIEHVYGAKSDQVATELAEHFEQARVYRRAIGYLRIAAANETRRFANREAVRWLEHALQLVGHLPPDERGGLAIGILNDLGRVRRSMGDMRASSEAFLSAARTADERGDTSETVEALLMAAGSLTWFDRSACIAAAGDAERLAATIGPPLALYAPGYAAYWRLVWQGWDDAEADACERALALADESRETMRLLSMLPRCAYVRLARGRYTAAARAASEGSSVALQQGDAFNRMVCQFYLAWAEVLAGRWGNADTLLTQSRQLAERNGHRSWHVLFGALRAWLAREAGALQPARELAEEAADAAQRVGAPFGQLVTRAQLGWALIETDEPRRGLDILDALKARLDHEPMLMGWIWRMPVHLGLSTAHRRCGDPTEAAKEASRVRQLAAESGEPTWLALGWAAQAELALAWQDKEEAEQALKHAVAALANVKAPLAAWRVHACAARAAETWGEHHAATAQRARAASIVGQLAASLPDASDLKRAFLESRDIRTVLAPAG